MSDREFKMPTTRESTPVVFVVDDDISVRESLELMIRYAGWSCETFASAAEFLAHPRVAAPSCLVLDVHLCSSESPPTASTCRSSSSPDSATCR